MYSFLNAVWTWAAESAESLMDLANAGRVTGNTYAVATAATLAVIRIAALALFIGPGVVCLWELIFPEDREERRVRVVLIVIIALSVAFELWTTYKRRAGGAV